MPFVRRILLIAALLLIIPAAGTVIPRPFLPRSSSANMGAAGVEILVLSNPIHTDIAVSLTEQTKASFADLAVGGIPIEHPDARWIIFGWGGRSFYIETPTWADIKPAPVFRALTLDRAVMHVKVAGEIERSSPNVASFKLTKSGFDVLLTQVKDSFVYDAGHPLPIAGAEYGYGDRFYEANGWFNALLGCNTWTAGILRGAGLRTGWWNPLPVSLMLSLRLYN